MGDQRVSLGHDIIHLVNKLHEDHDGIFSTLDLPQVAVVGSQGSGKSSVLEAIVGRDFLPKGSDICTRRPLVIQLVQIKDGTDEQEYGEFLHIPGRKFYDFDQIRTQIQAETDREAGGNKGISDKEIHLKIYSPNFLDITLVDLPGLTKLPVGDQPSDIEARVRTMIMSYIQNPKCLILAVTPQHADVANSDALQMARNVDPDGKRTIGVITKLDIPYRRTHAGNFTLEKAIPLHLDYVCVVNRSPEDIMLNRTIKDAIVAEEEYFRSLPVYNEIADHCGVPQLVKKMNLILLSYMKNAALLRLKSGISATLASLKKKLAAKRKIARFKRKNDRPVSLGYDVARLVDKLEDTYPGLDIFSTINLPQVAVVGSQGSGKSSVLEAIVGHDFLPKGSDVCTRRPLVIQLVQIKDGADEVEYGEFLHIPGRKFYDFNQIRTQIQAETDREAGGNKGISDQEIQLKIYSPNFLDITLVDLPGLTKLPVGDQPSDIEARVRTMIMSYIQNPKCLILAVTPQHADVANSDALQIAGNVDPDGKRTIGVITKLDIDPYRRTDAGNFTLGKAIPLSLGYVCVVNRSPEDIMLNRTIKDALVAEEEYFRSLPFYNKIADHCGVPQLVTRMNGILFLRIFNAALPRLGSRICPAIASLTKKLATNRKIAH